MSIKRFCARSGSIGALYAADIIQTSKPRSRNKLNTMPALVIFKSTILFFCHAVKNSGSCEAVLFVCFQVCKNYHVNTTVRRLLSACGRMFGLIEYVSIWVVCSSPLLISVYKDQKRVCDDSIESANDEQHPVHHISLSIYSDMSYSPDIQWKLIESESKDFRCRFKHVQITEGREVLRNISLRKPNARTESPEPFQVPSFDSL